MRTSIIIKHKDGSMEVSSSLRVSADLLGWSEKDYISTRQKVSRYQSATVNGVSVTRVPYNRNK